MIIVSMLISMSNFEMANDRLDYTNEKNKVNKDDANMYAKNLLIENNYKETQAKQYVPPAPQVPQVPPSLPTPPAPQVVHETQSPHANGIRQQPSLSQMQPPSYSEPKHNVAAGNMLSFPQNSSDLSGFEANDKYLSLENANTPAVNYSSEYKQKTNNSVSDYDGFDSDDKLSPF